MQPILRHLVFATLLLSIFRQASATGVNYFVSPTGNDANNGISALTPFGTLQHGLDVCLPGDTLNAMSGVFNEAVWVNGSGSATLGDIVLRPAPGATPILDGSGIADYTALLQLANVSYFVVDGIQFQQHSGVYQPFIWVSGVHDGIRIENCWMHDADSTEAAGVLVTGGGDGLVIRNNVIERLLGINAHPIAIYGDNSSISMRNVVIDSNVIAGCQPSPSECLTISGNVDSFRVAGNDLHQNNNIGIVMAGGYGWLGIPANLNHARNGVCRNNVVHDSNSPTGFAAGIYCDGCQDVVIESNQVVGSDVGIEVGCESPGFIASNVTVKNNVLHSNLKSGLGFGGYDYPNSTGNVKNCYFRNNTVVGNDIVGAGFGQLWITYAETCTVESNIFAAVTSNVLINGWDAGPGRQLVCDSNLYYVFNGGVANSSNEWNHSTYSGFAAFQAASGLEAHAFTQDPQFVAPQPTGYDLHCLPTSPARNAGRLSIVPAIGETDLDGRPRVLEGRIDIGAYEFDAQNGIGPSSGSPRLRLLAWPTVANEAVHLFACVSDDSPVTLRLIALDGSHVWEQTYSPTSGLLCTDIATDILRSGLYVLQVTTETGHSASVKISVVH